MILLCLPCSYFAGEAIVGIVQVSSPGRCLHVNLAEDLIRKADSWAPLCTAELEALMLAHISELSDLGLGLLPCVCVENDPDFPFLGVCEPFLLGGSVYTRVSSTLECFLPHVLLWPKECGRSDGVLFVNQSFLSPPPLPLPPPPCLSFMSPL